MKICGILITKEKSTRFPGKNRLLWEDNAKILIDCVGHENVYMFTDDLTIKTECMIQNISVIRKRVNLHDEVSYLEALRYAYYSLPERYDIIVTIQCNTVGHTQRTVMDGIVKIQSDTEAVEVRSFDEYGNQSGIYIFRDGGIPEKWHHMAAIESNGKEIHYKEDLEK